MIKFKTAPTYKYYFLTNFYNALNNIIVKLISILLILEFIAKTLFKSDSPEPFPFSIFFIFFFVLIYFLIPLRYFIYAKRYFKVENIEYCFDKTMFSYTSGGQKLEIKKEQIKHIKTRPNYILVELIKGKLCFVANKEEIARATKELLASDYKALFT